MSWDKATSLPVNTLISNLKGLRIFEKAKIIVPDFCIFHSLFKTKKLQNIFFPMHFIFYASSCHDSGVKYLNNFHAAYTCIRQIFFKEPLVSTFAKYYLYTFVCYKKLHEQKIFRPNLFLISAGHLRQVYL